MKIDNILQSIGKTPHVRINKLFDAQAEVWMKLERNNPGGSIKDRIALAMVEKAEHDGILTKDSIIVEPTSGNTGIGLAMVAAVKGYRLILVMPDSMSVERRKLMAAYDADFELTPREGGMKAALAKTEQLLKELPNAWSPSQFENPANPDIHTKTTALEIINDFPEGLDYLITGVGTGGHISGVAKVLKSHFPKLKVLAVEPEQSAVISGEAPGPHPIQGIGAGFIPQNLDTSILDGTVKISKEEAYSFAQKCARQEGILVGISTGASLAAVAKTLKQAKAGSKILTFNYDTGERYLSVEGLF